MTTETTFWMLGDLYPFKQTTHELAVLEAKIFSRNPETKVSYTTANPQPTRGGSPQCSDRIGEKFCQSISLPKLSALGLRIIFNREIICTGIIKPQNRGAP